jgi:hypothetical protein
MPLYNETTESIAMAIATLERAVYRELIEEAKYKGLITYLENQKKTYHVTALHVEQAQNKLDDWEDMVDYRGMTEEEMDMQTEEDNDDLYSAAEELLNDFNQDFGKDDDEMLREEEVKVSEWKKQTDEIKAWLNMSDKDRAASNAAAKKWVNKWVSERVTSN